MPIHRNEINTQKLGYSNQKKIQKIHLPEIEPGSIITKYHTQGRLDGLLYSVDFHRAWNRRYGSSFEPFRQGVPRAHPDNVISLWLIYIQTVMLSLMTIIWHHISTRS